MTRFGNVRQVAMVLVIAAFSLTGCGLLGPKGDDGADNGDGTAAGIDMAKMMSESAEAPYMIALHSGAEVGQWAEWDMSGNAQWWGVTGTEGDSLVVEMRMKTGDTWVTYAYVCDAEGMVSDAYIANYDPDGEPEAGYQIKVGVKPEDVAGGDVPETETGDESINAAGQDWACTWTSMDVAGKNSKSWMCEDGWFNKLIKSEYDGKVTMTLSNTGTDATLGLKMGDEGMDEGMDDGDGDGDGDGE